MFECTPLCQIWPPVLLYYSVQISHELSPQHLPSPPNIPLLPLNVSIYVWGEAGGDGGGTNWLLTNPTSYWFPIATVCLAASYYANIANISEHTRPICPHCWNFEKISIGLNSKVFGVELKTYDPSSPLSSPHCCLFPALRQQSFIRGKGLSSISGGTGGDFLWMNSKCFSLLIYINYTFLVTSSVFNAANHDQLAA